MYAREKLVSAINSPAGAGAGVFSKARVEASSAFMRLSASVADCKGLSEAGEGASERRCCSASSGAESSAGDGGAGEPLDSRLSNEGLKGLCGEGEEGSMAVSASISDASCGAGEPVATLPDTDAVGANEYGIGEATS